MKKTLLLFIILLTHLSISKENVVNREIKLHAPEIDFFLSNEVLLKGNELMIAKRIIPSIRAAISDSIISLYCISDEELAYVLLSIAMSESSKQTKHGAVVFQSVLMRRGFNAFGIKGRGIPIGTYEHINKKDSFVQSSFMKFASFEECIKFEVETLFINNKRYNNALKAITGEAFLLELHKAGYATSPTWFNNFTIPMYTKIFTNEHRKNSFSWTIVHGVR